MFRESVRNKIQEQYPSYTKLFLALDVDRDGRVSPGDLARYLRRCNISQLGLEKEIESWFSELTDRPDIGLDCPQFARFLHTAAPLPAQQPLTLSRREEYDVLGEEQLARLREHFVKHMARLGCNRNQYYNALTGGRGLLYSQRLREVVEQGEQRALQEDEWRNVYAKIKTDRRVDSVTREELFCFMFNEAPAKAPQEVAEEYTRGELEPPADLREPYGENTPEFMSFSRHVPRPLSGAQGESRPRSPNLLRLRASQAGQATLIQGSAEAVFALLSEKLRQAGAPRAVFHRLDVQKTGRVSYRVFSQQLQLLFGLEVCPEQLKQVLTFMFPEAEAVDFLTYEAFLAFYDPGTVLEGPGRSSAAQNQRKVLEICQPEQETQSLSSSRQSQKNQESTAFVECTKSPVSASTGSTGVLRAEVPERYTSTMQLSYMPQRALEKIVVTDAQNEQNKDAAQAAHAFRAHVKKMLDNRRINMSVLVRESFPGKKTLAARELLWLFRNKVGVSYSQKAIVESLGITEGFIKTDQLIRLFD